MSTALIAVELDTGRTGSYGGTWDNITEYVTNDVQWRMGMMAEDEEVAQPARLILKLSNGSGVFNQEVTGAEAILNGGFDSWSGDNPVNWTVTGESGSDPEVEEVGASQGNGGTGTGLCNLYTTSAALSISQDILIPGERYECVLEIDNFTTNTPGGIVCKSGSTAVSPVYHIAGRKTFWFYATDDTFTIAADAGNGTVNATIASVSVKRAPRYYRALRRGTLVRVRATTPSATTLYTGKIEECLLNAGTLPSPVVHLACDDPMLEMLSEEFAPEYQEDVTINQTLAPVFDGAVIPFPYAHSYWMVGVEGASELGTTTTVYNHAATSFDTGATTLSFVGDISDKGRGVSIQSYLRDMVAAEAGGIFFWDPRNSRYNFFNRTRFIGDSTDDAVFTDDDLDQEGTEYVQDDDLVNAVTIEYTPRKVGAAAETLWTCNSVPFEVRPKQTKVITARFQDVNQTSARISARNLIAPTFFNGDITHTLKQDGTGAFSRRFTNCGFEGGAQSAKITFTNSNKRTSYWVQSLRVRGTPIRTYERRTVTHHSADSWRDFRKFGISKPVLAIDSDELAEQYADWLVSKRANPTPRFRRISITANRSDALLAQALARTVGDRINVVDASKGHDQDYFILGEQHALYAGGSPDAQKWVVTYTLTPASRQIYWKVETAGWGELQQTTRLAF